ncbi:unnamed protein product [Prunus armeniaca]
MGSRGGVALVGTMMEATVAACGAVTLTVDCGGWFDTALCACFKPWLFRRLRLRDEYEEIDSFESRTRFEYNSCSQ